MLKGCRGSKEEAGNRVGMRNEAAFIYLPLCTFVVNCLKLYLLENSSDVFFVVPLPLSRYLIPGLIRRVNVTAGQPGRPVRRGV